MKQKENSGQILLIAAFIMASLLLSAQLYILDVGEVTEETQIESLSAHVIAVKQGSRHVVIGSLANISQGGQNSTLDTNLQRWSVLIEKQYLFGRSVLDYMLLDVAPYTSGVWLNWGADGIGISSACSNFAHSISDFVSVGQSFSINATTTLMIHSHYQNASDDRKQVNITIQLFNEADPAPAKHIATYYRIAESWQITNATHNYAVLDYGNGTYVASFLADIPSQTVEVSVHVADNRDVYVQANVSSEEA